MSTLFHRYITFYSEFKGDIASPLAQLNSYSLDCRCELARQLKKKAGEIKIYDSNFFNTDKVQEYMKTLDTHCKNCLEVLFVYFQIYSNPIVSVPD